MPSSGCVLQPENMPRILTSSTFEGKHEHQSKNSRHGDPGSEDAARKRTSIRLELLPDAFQKLSIRIRIQMPPPVRENLLGIFASNIVLRRFAHRSRVALRQGGPYEASWGGSIPTQVRRLLFRSACRCQPTINFAARRPCFQLTYPGRIGFGR